MRRRWRAAASACLAQALSLACLVVGCEQFETQVSYRGARLLSDKPLRVRTVFWPPSGPMVFAMERDDGDSVLHMVPLSGEASCRTAPVNRFAAFVDDGRLTVGLWDARAGRARFFDEDCSRWEPDLSDVRNLSLRSGPGGHRFLLETGPRESGPGDWYLVRPRERRLVQLASDVERLGGGMFQVGGRDAFWVLAGKHLGLIDERGEEIGPGFDNVSQFAIHVGVGSDLSDHGYLVVQDDARRIRMHDVTDRLAGQPPTREALMSEPIWQEDGACGPRIDVVAASCAPGSCADEDPTVRASQGLRQVPWVSYYSPCDSETLVLRPDAEGPAFSVVEGVERYRVLGLAKEGRPVVVYHLQGDPSQDYVQVVGGEPQGLGVRTQLDSVSMLGPAPSLVFETSTETSEDRPDRWTTDGGLPDGGLPDGGLPDGGLPDGGLLDGGLPDGGLPDGGLPDGGLPDGGMADEGVPEEELPRFLYWVSGAPEPRVVLTDVMSSAIDGLALHDFAGGVGRLSECLVPRCIPVAEDVLPGQYASYDTVERVGDGMRVFAYIHRADGEAGTGVLSVQVLATGEVIDVADGASDFMPVELGAARGLVYTIPSGPDRGLWFAPR